MDAPFLGYDLFKWAAYPQTYLQNWGYARDAGGSPSGC
jgi:hypothetical protein